MLPSSSLMPNRQRRIRRRTPDIRSWRPTLLIFVGAATLLQTVHAKPSFSSCDMVLVLPSVDPADDNPDTEQGFYHRRRRKRRIRELQEEEEEDDDYAVEGVRDWDNLSSSSPDASLPRKVHVARGALNLAYVASALLAIDHLKSGDGSIVPEIAQRSACTSRLPFSSENLFLLRDSESDDDTERTMLMNELWNRLYGSSGRTENNRGEKSSVNDGNIKVNDDTKSDAAPLGDGNTTCTNEPQRPPTCAVIGPILRDSITRRKGSTLEHVVGYMASSRAPHISAGSTATSPSTTETFQNKAHMSTVTEVVVEYLFQAWSQQRREPRITLSNDGHRHYIGALYQAYNEYGLTFQKYMLQQQEDRYGELDIRFQRLPSPRGSSPSSRMRDSLLSLRDLGYRTIVVALEEGLSDRALISLLVRCSHELGMVGHDFVWVLVADGPTPGQDILPEDWLPDEPSAHQQWKEFFGCVVMLRMLDGYSDEGLMKDPFVTAWQQQQNSTLLDRVKSSVARSGGFSIGDDSSRGKAMVGSISDTIRKDSALAEGNEVALEMLFNNLVTGLPPARTAFVYDSIVAVGLAACQQLSSRDQGAYSKALAEVFGILSSSNNDNRNDPTSLKDDSNIFEEQNGSPGEKQNDRKKGDAPTSNTSLSVIEALKNVTFQGASGEVGFRETGNCRTKGGLRFGMFRFLEGDAMVAGANANSRREDQQGLQPVLTSVRTDERGWRTVDTSQDTSQVPQAVMMSRTVVNHHSLSPYVFGPALALMSSVLLICVVTMRWICRMRRTALLNTSEPKMLVLMCFGSAVTATSILSLTLADADLLSSSQRSRACMATPWLFIGGLLLTYTAIFVKLWKASAAQNEQRTKLSGMHWSFAAVVAFTILSLFLWTTLKPLKWTILVVKDFPLETIGQCHSSSSSVFFHPIVFLLIMATFFIAFAAWVVREIPGESCDCGWILYACLTQLQCWAVGLPFLYIINSGGLTNASYVGCVVSIWCFAVSPQVVMLWPRMVAASWRRVRCSSTAGADCKGKLMLSAAAASATAGAPASSLSDAEATPPLSTGGTGRCGGRRPSISSASEGVQSSSALGESPFNRNMEVGGEEEEEEVSVSVTNGARSAYDEEEANTVETGGGRSASLFPGDHSIVSHETTYSESERISMAISLQQRRAMAGLTANHIDYRLVALEAHKRVLMLEKQLSSLGQRVETADRLADVDALGREFRSKRRR